MDYYKFLKGIILTATKCADVSEAFKALSLHFHITDKAFEITIKVGRIN